MAPASVVVPLMFYKLLFVLYCQSQVEFEAIIFFVSDRGIYIPFRTKFSVTILKEKGSYALQKVTGSFFSLLDSHQAAGISEIIHAPSTLL